MKALLYMYMNDNCLYSNIYVKIKICKTVLFDVDYQINSFCIYFTHIYKLLEINRYFNCNLIRFLLSLT